MEFSKNERAICRQTLLCSCSKFIKPMVRLSFIERKPSGHPKIWKFQNPNLNPWYQKSKQQDCCYRVLFSYNLQIIFLPEAGRHVFSAASSAESALARVACLYIFITTILLFTIFALYLFFNFSLLIHCRFKVDKIRALII